MNVKIEELKTLISANPELLARVQGLEGKSSQEIAAALEEICKEAGISITQEEILQSVGPESLSDRELESVSGGVWRASSANIGLSILSMGVGCAIYAAVSVSKGNVDSNECQPDQDGRPR